jgi:hypothetical protein
MMALDQDAEREARYAARRRIADEGVAEIAKAIDACGPGATAYGMHVITDRTGELPDRVIYCCRRPTHTGWQPSVQFPGWDERIETPGSGFEVKGVTYYPFRFKFAFGALNEYRPQTPEQMKRAAEARQAKRDEAERTKQAEADAARAVQLELALGGER